MEDSTLLEGPGFWGKQKNNFLLFCKEYKAPFIASLIAGLMAYMYMFANKIPIRDELGYSFSKGATVTSGRWGLKILYYIIPNYSMPWLWGILSLVLFAVAVCIILHTLQIKDKLLQIAVATVFVTFPSFADTFAFMFTSLCYAIAVVFSALAVYFLKKSIEKKIYYLFSIFFCIATLSIYQAYISLIAGLALLLLINLSVSHDWKKLFKRALLFLLVLVVSVAVYAGITFLSLKLLSTEFNSYAQNGMFTSPYSIPMRIAGLFYIFLKNTFLPSSSMVTPLSAVTNIVLFISMAVVYFAYAVAEIKKKNSKLKLILIAVFVILIPAACNAFFLLADRLHLIMRAGYFCAYALGAVLVIFIGTENKKKIYTRLVAILLLVTTMSNIYIANKAYLLMDYTYRETYSFYTALTAQIRMTEGYTEDTKVYIIGETKLAREVEDKQDFTQPDLVNAPYKGNFLKYYTSSDLKLASDKDTLEFIQKNDLSDMPDYPDDGSVRMIDGCIVVKLSEADEKKLQKAPTMQ